MNNDKVIVVGAGIAGLSVAKMLAEGGVGCVVLESRVDFGVHTSGVRVSAEGVAILEKLGIRNIGESSRRLIMCFGWIIADFICYYPAGVSPAIIVSRMAIHEKLMESMKLLGVEVVTGFKLSHVMENPDGIVAISEDGQSVAGKFLVGADGVGSTVRKILNVGEESSKTYAGYLGVGVITPNNAKIEMTLYHYPGHNVGLASVGKVSSKDATNHNAFLWTHFYMSEASAKATTNDMAANLLEARAREYWGLELTNILDMFKAQPGSIISCGPVYNGREPSKWHSSKMILIGDAAHPFGPGGQGISMALKDAEAVCDMLLSGVTEEKKEMFQSKRGKEAKTLGEAAETRNKPENQIGSWWGVVFKGILIKIYHFFTRGVMNI